ACVAGAAPGGVCGVWRRGWYAARRCASAAACCAWRSSSARSGAAPAQSRSRLSSRAWATKSAVSTARPRTAAKPANAPSVFVCSLNDSPARTATVISAMLRDRAGVGTDAGGRELCDARREAGGVALQDQQGDVVEHLLDHVGVERLALDAHDLLDRRGLRPLVGIEQLLV